VKFVGPKYGDELLEILRGASAVVVPTEWYDNSPLVICQAFAMGKPVIASNIDGIPEVVTHEVDGLLFNPGDAVALREQINHLHHNPHLCRRYGDNARLKAVRLYTGKRRFTELVKILNFAMQRTIH